MPDCLPSTEQKLEKINTMISACTHFLKSHKPESKFEDVKDEVNLILKTVLDWRHLFHDPDCGCGARSYIYRGFVSEGPMETVVWIDDSMNIFTCMGFDLPFAFISPTPPIKTTMEELVKLNISPFDCVKFVLGVAEEIFVQDSMTQPAAQA